MNSLMHGLTKMFPDAYMSREEYIENCRANHLHWAKVFHRLGREDTMWSQIWNYTIAEDYYGEIFDRVRAK